MKTYYITWRNSLLQLPQYPCNIDRKPGNMGRTLAFPCSSGITVLVSMAKVPDTVFFPYLLPTQRHPPPNIKTFITTKNKKILCYFLYQTRRDDILDPDGIPSRLTLSRSPSGPPPLKHYELNKNKNSVNQQVITP